MAFFALSVSPASPGLDRAHALEVHGDMGKLGSGAGSTFFSNSAFPYDLSRQKAQQRLDAGAYDIKEFQAGLDGLIALARAAWDALTRWPMGPM